MLLLIVIVTKILLVYKLYNKMLSSMNLHKNIIKSILYKYYSDNNNPFGMTYIPNW